MSADPDKQQIPPLRCAPVGMTNMSITLDTGARLRQWDLAFAPFEFGAEDAEEAVGAAAQETNARFGALAVDVIAETKGDCHLAVDGEVDLVGNTYDVDADGGFAGGDDGPDGQQVRADGGDQQGVDAGHNDGAIGGEVVGGGASGGGD